MTEKIIEKIVENADKIAEKTQQASDMTREVFGPQNLRDIFTACNWIILGIVGFVIIFSFLPKKWFPNKINPIRNYLKQLAYRGHGEDLTADIRKLTKVIAYFWVFIFFYLKLLAPAIIANRISEWLIGGAIAMAGAITWGYVANKAQDEKNKIELIKIQNGNGNHKSSSEDTINE